GVRALGSSKALPMLTGPLSPAMLGVLAEALALEMARSKPVERSNDLMGKVDNLFNDRLAVIATAKLVQRAQTARRRSACDRCTDAEARGIMTKPAPRRGHCRAC